ncbi:g1970 [Coccomyxa viridis]|uniref:G1970 protein n=1 Tax=Coccomyxa viridis TaxID=1274662 RepID=A0ABP1FN03_9CHLO
MRSVLLLLGLLAYARASFIDLNNINTPTDALTYVLNLKCIQAQFYTWAAHGKGLDIGLLGYNGPQVLDGKLNNTKSFSYLDDHLDYKTTCQEYKDCPSQCQDQACKDRCLLKTCYYYHCSTYKTCWDACFDNKDCQAQCSYKGCDYGLINNIQGQLDQDAQAQGQLINGTLKVAGGVQKAVDTDVANQVNDLGKQQAVLDHAIQDDVHSQQYVLNKTADELGKQQAVVDHAIQNDVQSQAYVLNKTIIDAGKQQAVVDHAIASDLDKQQKVLNKTVTTIGTQVVKDVLTQQQFLDQFIGGQKAQLSWYVQLIAEQLSWGDAEHVKLIRTLLGSQAPECPNMDISTNTWNEIITLALGKNSGLTSKFNPYYDDVSFMAAAYLFEDLAVSAYAGIMNQFQADQALQQQIVKILSVDSYQSGLVRSWLFSNGANPIQWFSSLQVVDLAQKISDWRGQVGGGLDEGITIPKIQSGLWVPQVTLPAYKLAIAPTDEQGLIYERKPVDVANVLYGGDYQKPGLFFPDGFKFGL